MAIQRGNDLPVPMLIHGYTAMERPTCTNIHPWLYREGTTYLNQCLSMATQRVTDLPVPMLIHGYTERERPVPMFIHGYTEREQPTFTNGNPWLNRDGTTYL